MRRRPCCCFGFIAIIATLAGGYWYGSIALRESVASAVESQLPVTLGPAKHYDATVNGGVVGLLRGRIEAMRVVGDDVELRNGLQLDHIHALLRDVRLNSSRTRIARIGGAEFRASAGQRQLNEYCSRRYSDVPGCSLKLRDGSVTLYAQPSILGRELKLAADARLRVENGHRVVVDITQVRAQGYRIPTPDFARQFLEEGLNPILDTAGWGFGVKLKSVTTTEKDVTLVGTASLAGIAERF
jgi:hypothetical protein